MGAQGTKKTVYEIVTEQILIALAKGVVPWRKPWATGFHDPVNITGRRYRGINRVLLGLAEYACPVWLTWKQIQERGGHVRRGEHAQLVVYWLERNRPTPTAEGSEGRSSEKHEDAERTGRSGGLIPLYYRVFNIEQTEGIELPEKYRIAREALSHSTREIMDLADGVVRTMPNPPAIGMGGDRAYYRPATDHIQMPPREAFRDAAGYANTLFHEATHATGHPSRLGRVLPESLAPFGSEDYSREELVAEIGACFVMRRTGIGSDLTNSAAYIHGWLKALEENPTWIIGASTQAQRASDYILGPEERETADPAEGGTDGESAKMPAEDSAAPVVIPAATISEPERLADAVVPTAAERGSTDPKQSERKRTAKQTVSSVPRRSSPEPAEKLEPTPPTRATPGCLSLTVDRKAFSEALTRARKAIPRRNTLQAVTHVLLIAGREDLTLVGTDLEVVRRERIPAEVEGAGSLTLPASPLQTLVSRLKSAAHLSITATEGSWIDLRAGSAHYRVAGGPASEYPTPFTVASSVGVTFPAAPLARGLGRVQHAMGCDPTRSHLCGVYLEPHPSGLRLVATDGHRLTLDRVPGAALPPLEHRDGIILPRNALPSLLSLLQSARDVEVYVDQHGIEFRGGGGSVATRFVEGDYPEYERVIPPESPHPARIRVGELAAAIDRVRVVAPDRNQGVRFDLTHGELTVAANDPNLGEATERISIEYNGVDVTLGFNAGYLLDVLEVARESEEILFSIRDGLSQAAFRLAGDAEFLAIVMPMRI